MSDPDPLQELRDQVRATQAAAQRLMGDGVPPRGWESPRAQAGAFAEEVQALAALAQALRELVPPDLGEQLRDLVRQLLLIVRALIDWLVAAIDERAATAGESGGESGAGAGGAGGAGGQDAPPRGEDIPIA